MNPWNDSDGFAREARKVESAGEATLLSLLWWRRDGWTVRAQEPIEQYRIDLFVPEAGVAIEVDSFGGHGSAEAMERDARKRNLVVARGWAPLAFSAQQALFRSQDALADALAVINGRMMAKRPATPPARPRPVDLADFAAGGRALLAALQDGPSDDLVLSASHRVLANRGAAEYLGVELLQVVLDCPELVRDDDIGPALDAIEGPVALAAQALREALPPGGTLDRAAFLQRCPALLQPVAARRLDAPVVAGLEAARAQAVSVLDRLGGT